MEKFRTKEKAGTRGGNKLAHKATAKALEQKAAMVNGKMKRYSELTPEDQMRLSDPDFTVRSSPPKANRSSSKLRRGS